MLERRVVTTPQFLLLHIEDAQSGVEMGHLLFFLITEVMRGICGHKADSHLNTFLG